MLPTFCELGGEVLPSRAAKKKQLQLQDHNLLKCGSCGGHAFAFDMEQMALRCLQCGAELIWEADPGVPKARPKSRPSVKIPAGTQKQAAHSYNTGFANAEEMLAALGLQQKKKPVQQGRKPVNAGFSSAREMLAALGIQLDDAENK